MRKTVIVTRHPAYVEYLIQIGLIGSEAEVIPHATPADVRGNIVITSGLPFPLAALAHSVVIVPLWLPPELRGVELSVEEVAAHAKEPKHYVVKELAIR
jgi:hypothetical protein